MGRLNIENVSYFSTAAINFINYPSFLIDKPQYMVEWGGSEGGGGGGEVGGGQNP